MWPCLVGDGTSYPLLHHLVVTMSPDSRAELPPTLEAEERGDDEGCAGLPVRDVQLYMLRELAARWRADVRSFDDTKMIPTMALHVVAAIGNLPSVKYIIEECGLTVDELVPEELFTPLTYALFKGIKNDEEDEEQVLPVIRYLLAQGADINAKTRLGFTAAFIALDKEWLTEHELLVSHARAKEAERERREAEAKELVDALLVARQREADEAAQALLAELEAEEVRNDQVKKGKRGKGGKGGKKKRGDASEQGPPKGERKKEEKEEMKLEGIDGGRNREMENEFEQLGRQQEEGIGGATMADVEAATGGMTLADGKEGDGGLQTPGVDKLREPADDTFLEDAPDEYICPLEMCLMTEDPVVASDGFMYSKKGLERWIAHCAAKGRPLTSPKTGELMEAVFIISKTHRTLVRDWVEGRKAMLGKK